MRARTIIPKKSSIEIAFRPFRESNIRAFGEEITSTSWSYLLEHPTVEDMASDFQDSLSRMFHLHFPLVNVKRRSRDKPWITKRILSLIKERQCAFKSNRMAHYRNLRNRVKREVQVQKDHFYSQKVMILRKSNPKSWHQQIRSITGMNKRATSLPGCEMRPIDQANLINGHFARICSQLPPLDISTLQYFLPASQPPPRVEAYQVHQELRKLNASKSCHHDDVPVRLITEFAPELAEPLAMIFNSSLESGIFPDCWKNSDIVPIPKTFPCNSVDLLRLISLTPTFAKVFESFLTKWLYQDIRNKIDKQQFGNIKGSSTSHYMISLIDSILKGFSALQHDESLRSQGITLEIGRAKNINKNPVAEKAVRELEDELLRDDPRGGPVTPLALALATARLNSRIRGVGLSARELWTQRDQFTSEQIPLRDMDVITNQHEKRLSNHGPSMESKAPKRLSSMGESLVHVGDLVYLRSDRTKTQARPRYLVCSVDNDWCNIRKFVGSQLRSTSYRVRRSDCLKVPPGIPTSHPSRPRVSDG
ncbi:uncharacterized protein LOC135156869 [Lytechinus pictus]|uniref:uncharacterized protein LOC135156869 n=1 Tax=Lytechinus pictus TaxID=7653 RepID=UPI0030B9B3D2